MSADNGFSKNLLKVINIECPRAEIIVREKELVIYFQGIFAGRILRILSLHEIVDQILFFQDMTSGFTHPS